MGNEIFDLLIRRLDRIEKLILEQHIVREWYTTHEFAARVDKAEFTVRVWCRHSRIEAKKRRSGRGSSRSWTISHEEFRRYQREGLLHGRSP